jgi:thiamine kinase-like enzyme
MLQSVSDLGIPNLAFTASPRQDLFISLQTAVPGKRWKDELRPDQPNLLNDYLDRISTWVAQFQTRVRAPIRLSHAAEELRQRSTIHLQSTEEQQLFSSFARNSETLGSLPAVAAHGDLWPGNVLDMAGKIHVIDWATFHYGSPLEDLHNFAVGSIQRTSRSLDSGTDELWKLFFGGSPLMKLLQAKTSEHLNRLTLGADVIQPLFQMFLIQRLTHPEFRYHSTWRKFTSRYVREGMPTPFS